MDCGKMLFCCENSISQKLIFKYNATNYIGLSTLYTKGYSYAVGGGVVLSKDIALSTRILLEPTINVRINKPIASWGIARFGYGLKLKYVL